MGRSVRLALAAFVAAVAVGSGGGGAWATAPADSPVVSLPVHMDVSPPLGSLQPANFNFNSSLGNDRHAKPIPTRGGSAPIIGASPAVPAKAAPAVGTSFEGIGLGTPGYGVAAAPPDPNGAVGPNHYVEVVNADYAVYNKSGTLLYGPVPVNTAFLGFGGGCEIDNDGDPTILYDRLSDRWVISQFAVTTTRYLNCVAVSTSPDPLGTYYRYSYSYADFPDYPKFGVWPDGYYVSMNMFAGGTTFSGGRACSYDRAKMLVGLTATQQCFSTGINYGGMLPSTLDGSRLPPAGSPDYFLALDTSSTLVSWKFHVDWTTPANSTFAGPTSLNVAPYAMACNGTACIPQPGTTQGLDALGDRLMYRLAYRNFGDHESLVVNHSVAAGSSVGVRWYELRVSSGNLTVYQQGTYAPDSNYRWMGSIAMDQSGNMGLGYSVSSSTIRPSIRYTGRLASDPLGTMPQGEGTIITGAGSQTGGLSRWGDYTSMAVDPVDDCTFWYTNEYLRGNGSFNWSTRVGTFKFPSCNATPPANDFSIAATPSSLSIQQGVSGASTISTALIRGSAEIVTLSASGVPANATASFNPPSVTAGGSSTLTLTMASNSPAGNYTVTVNGAATSGAHTTPVALTVTSLPGADPIVNGGFATGNLSGWTTSGVVAVSAGAAHSGLYGAQVGATGPGGNSAIAQTFTAPSAGGTLSFWYQVHCPDTVAYDWATATLRDNLTNVTTTLLAKTCSNSSTWVRVTTNLSSSAYGGHSLTLTLANHDDNYPGDPTFTYYDDVTFASNTPPAPDFSLSVNPSSQAVVQGLNTSYSVVLTPSGGFMGSVTFSVSGLPAGASGSFGPNPTTGPSTLSITTATSTTPGSYPLTITGTSGTLIRTTSATVVVNAAPTPDFSLSVNPSSQTVVQGASTTYAVTLTPAGGFTGSATLSVGGLPAGASGTFSPNPATGISTLSVTTATSVTPGAYPFTITGTSGSIIRTTSATLVVNAAPTPDFTLSVNPSSRTIIRGANTSYNVALTPSGGFIGSVMFSVSGLPVGVGGTFSPNPATGTSTLTVTTAPSTTPGTYLFTIIGTSGALTRTVTATLVITAPNFSLSVLPTSVTAMQGTSATYALTITASGGFNGSVALSASGLPAGAIVSFSPNPSGTSSTLTVATSLSTPPGIYLFTVTGTSGTITRTVTVTLVVTAATGCIGGNGEC